MATQCVATLRDGRYRRLIGKGDPGGEIEGPMAVVILGGLMTAMILNLLVLPTLALAFGRFDRDLEGAAA